MNHLTVSRYRKRYCYFIAVENGVQIITAWKDERCCSAQSSARLQGPPSVCAHHAQPAAWCMQHGHPQRCWARKKRAREDNCSQQCGAEFHSSGSGALA